MTGSGVAIDWLLEPDSENPGVRYFALRDLLGLGPEDAELREAQAAVMATGPVPRILAAQHPDGYWAKPGAGYGPKYQGTAWQIVFLGELAADGADTRVAAGCRYLLEHTQTATGGFGCSAALRTPPPPSSVVHCLNGNLLWALIGLGWLEDTRIGKAIEWQARSITGSDPDVRYYRSGTNGPGFACGVNQGQPCGWGAAKAIRALLAVPPHLRDAETQRALELGAQFFLSQNPAQADYPYSGRVSGTWFRFGFLPSYWSDVLEVTEILVDLDYGNDPRLPDAFDLILSKRDAAGRWRLENSLNGKTWAQIEAKGKPSKWVTLRALRTLRKAGRVAE